MLLNEVASDRTLYMTSTIESTVHVNRSFSLHNHKKSLSFQLFCTLWMFKGPKIPKMFKERQGKSASKMEPEIVNKVGLKKYELSLLYF